MRFIDTRHRVYYLVNLNQNHTREGWWSKGWDDYGFVYEKNLQTLKRHAKSLKIRQCNKHDRGGDYYQMKISCKKEDESILRDLLDKLPDVDYIQLWRL